ncbi:MAG TPA: hypothetical protein G4N99_13720 [Thermoflexia bacterium]|nr:hypothetical protein [Thermoflexia bacterium]
MVQLFASMTLESSPHKIPAPLNLLILALLCVILAQAVGSAARTSLTIDEGLHITSGYTILRAGGFRLVEEHPPLVKVWAAMPLLAVPDLPDPRALPPWEKAAHPTTESLPLLQMTQQWLYPYQPIDRLVFPARAMVALLAVLLGAVVFRWAADLGGWKGGLLALFLLAFDPNILAHASVAGTDLGAVCFITLALFALARFLRRPTFPRLAFAGLTLGLAQGAKLSALVLLPVVLLLCLLALRRRRLLSLALIFLIAGLTLWAIYGFEIGSVPGVSFPLPAASHSIPWLRLRQHMVDGHAAFLLSENSTQGWWYYFPVAFALKTPLPALALLLAATITFWKGTRRSLREESVMLLFPLLYGASSLFSNLNIGYRHLLPILPFLFIFISRITNYELRITHHALRITFYALLFWLAIGTARLSPHYLAYFNELAGGPDGGYRYLADSNTDWGQAYRDLAHFQQERGLGPVRLSAFIFYDPAIYGVEYEPLTPMRGDTPAVFPSRFDPPPGDYIISATTLDGIPLADPEMYDWFRKRQPDAKIAHVLFYYHVPERELEPTWLAQCTAPTAPLSPQVAAEGFGRDDLRLAYFDCAQAWLYPEGGRSPGLYAFYRGGETEGDFTRAQHELAWPVYEQRAQRDTPPFTIYEWSPAYAVELMGDLQAGPVIVAPSDWTPEQAEADGASLSPPLSFDGPLAFLGYRLETESAAPGETLILWTYWSVSSIPDSPLSLMAHLLDRKGQPVAAGDGLGVPVESWQIGDVILQRHILEIPPDAAPGTYWVQTGAYALADLQRLAVTSDGQPIGDRIVLARLEVDR